jgi:hypothetical protein
MMRREISLSKCRRNQWLKLYIEFGDGGESMGVSLEVCFDFAFR